MASPKPDPKAKKPLQFGKPEPSTRRTMLIKVAIIIFALGAIFWMVLTNPPQKEYNCRADVHAGLTDIGSCTTE